MPKVSIIMPYYNAASYIFETVKSIVDQEYNDWELIIIDDCSTDTNTIEILSKVEGMDNRIKVLQSKINCGAGCARNIGIREAKGRYIAFCDSDDWWYPNKLKEQLEWMELNGYEFTCTWYEDANECLAPYYTMKQKVRQNFTELISGCNIGTPGVVYDTKRIGKKYMPNLRRAEDWGLWMKILKDVDYIYTYPKALWKYRHVSGSETSNKWKQMEAVVTMYREVLGFSIFRSYIVSFCVFLPKNIWKKFKKSLCKD